MHSKTSQKIICIRKQHEKIICIRTLHEKNLVFIDSTTKINVLKNITKKISLADTALFEDKEDSYRRKFQVEV